MSRPVRRSRSSRLAAPAAAPTRGFERDRLLRALDGMTEEDRLVLALQLVDGLADEETARALGLTVRGVRGRRERLLLALRRAIAGLPFGTRPAAAPVRSAA